MTHQTTETPAARLAFEPLVRQVCQHERTHFDPEGWPSGEDLEVCDDCGMSRTHWEQGESGWCAVDIPAERIALQAFLDAI